jgi:hypothetical protein
MIEFQQGENSVRYVDPESLNFLKEALIPAEVTKNNPIDAQIFSLTILLYSNSEVIGKVGVEFGDIQHLHYSIEGTYYGKSEMNYRLGMFIQDIRF